MRWNLLLAVGVVLGWSTPCAADYVLLWTSPALFPASPISGGAPIPSGYLGDFNGDGRLDIVHTPSPDNPHLLQIRDVITGALEGELNILVDAGGAVTNVGVLDIPSGLPEIIASYVKSDGSGVRGIAVYGWRVTAGVSGTPGASSGASSVRPNPFSQRTVIDFALSAPGSAEIQIFDLAGRMVRKLDTGRLAAGPNQIEWDGTDGSRRLSAGTYFYAVRVNGLVIASQKAVMLQ